MKGLLAKSTCAPVKAIELPGESPDRGSRYRPVANGNCVFNRKGGGYPKANEQSVTKVNSIRPSLSGSVLVNREPLTSRSGPKMTPGQPAIEPVVGEAAHTVTKRGDVLNRDERNGSRVVGDGMFRNSIEISRET